MAKMSKTRIVYLQKLKKEHVEKYLDYHNNIWPELEKTYRDHGITDISCFLDGCDLMVYMERDDQVYEKARKDLGGNPIEQKWQKIMNDLKDDSVNRAFKEVYRFK
jgi:L-rhamnose mutarotase